MSPDAIAVIITVCGFVLSFVSSVLVVGIAWGKMRADIAYLQAGRAELATKEQVNGLATQIAEIRGMFRMTLKSENETPV